MKNIDSCPCEWMEFIDITVFAGEFSPLGNLVKLDCLPIDAVSKNKILLYELVHAELFYIAKREGSYQIEFE